PAVLRALDLALDRAGLVRDVLAGAGRPARGLYPRALAGFAAGSPLPAGPDVAAATRALSADGWAPGPGGGREKLGRRLAVGLVGICGRSGIDRELDLVRRQWLPLGAAVTTSCEPREVFFQRQAAGAFDLSLYSNEWAPDPAAWAPVGATGAAENWNRCQD